MHQSGNSWGAELIGEAEDTDNWRTLLKAPFDPYVEQVQDTRGDYLVLRSSAFDGLYKQTEVHQTAKELFKMLNVAFSNYIGAGTVSNGAVVEFSLRGLPKRHIVLEVESFTISARLGSVSLSLTDAKGNVIPEVPTPSIPQIWIAAAQSHSNIGSAMRYIYGQPGWVELYKAYEALKDLPRGSITGPEVNRFTHTANVNVDDRHHPNPKREPHPNPMSLWEARALITQWISCAVNQVAKL